MTSPNYIMTRQFLPVGQGAFYMEKFLDDFTLVYDCGSYQNIEQINKSIDNSDLVDKIDLLVISHFHEDHINGLEHLFKNFTIKKMLLPYLDLSEKILTYLDAEKKNSSNFFKDFILNPSNALQNRFGRTTEITYVKHQRTDNLMDEEEINYEELSNSIDSGNQIMINNSNMINNFSWIYIPFNFQNLQRTAKFKKFIADKKWKIKTIQDFKKYYKNNEKDMSDLYNKISGGKNTNSLTLLSASNNYKTVSYSRKRGNGFSLQQNLSACLYLGDYDAKGKIKMADLYKKYEKYFHQLSTIQIPHHGSKGNYNDRLNMYSNIISIISAGKKNNYGHPHPSTTEAIVRQNGIPIVVTEYETSKLTQRIYRRK